MSSPCEDTDNRGNRDAFGENASIGKTPNTGLRKGFTVPQVAEKHACPACPVKPPATLDIYPVYPVFHLFNRDLVSHQDKQLKTNEMMS